MRQASFSSPDGRWVVVVLVGLALGALVGCNNSMNFNPVAPEWPDWQSNLPGTRTLEIDGVLQIQSGACLEATVLYDGHEVPGARSRCPHPAGCAELELEAEVLTATGHHTISFQVVRQSQEVVDYRAVGTVLVHRGNLNLGLGDMPIRLGPSLATLEAGGAVDFGIQFTN